mmetsp:Transcript_27125/g.76200  ORF Transcript_27125/g.76200 Transcript_27125/m.76200 type:complete len:216 (+) Transcript_27125:164-811(+)
MFAATIVLGAVERGASGECRLAAIHIETAHKAHEHALQRRLRQTVVSQPVRAFALRRLQRSEYWAQSRRRRRGRGCTIAVLRGRGRRGGHAEKAVPAAWGSVKKPHARCHLLAQVRLQVIRCAHTREARRRAGDVQLKVPAILCLEVHGAAQGHNAAAHQHSDAVAQRVRLLQVMRAEDSCEEPRAPGQRCPHAAPCRHVHASADFVQQRDGETA